MIVILFGPPGSGKGSQAQLLVNKYDFFHISTGDLLRKEISLKTELGKKIKNLMNSGSFIQDDVINKLCFDEILTTTKENIVLDGFPRTLDQAECLENFLKENSLNVNLVLYFNLDAVKLEQRILGRFSCLNCNEVYHRSFKIPQKQGVCDTCGSEEFLERLDDNSEVLKNRVSVYLKETDPLKEYYKKKNILKVLDASYNMSVVNDNVINCLSQIGLKK